MRAELIAEGRVRVLEARKAELAGLVTAWSAKRYDVSIVNVSAGQLAEFSAEAKRVQGS